MLQINFNCGVAVIFIFLSTIGTKGSDCSHPSDDDSDDFNDYMQEMYTKPRFRSSLKSRKSQSKTDKQILADLTNPRFTVKQINTGYKKLNAIQSRDPRAGSCTDNTCKSCLDSCGLLKTSTASRDAITEYIYLRMCSEGCKSNIACITDNACIPVMKENPNFFIICANKCNLFEIVPIIFKSDAC